MSDSYSEYCYDQEKYLRLCEKYGQKPRHTRQGGLDCYGAHAGKLERLERGEEDKKKGKEVPLETEVKIKVTEDVICRLEKELGRSWKDIPWERQENIIYRNAGGFVRFRREGGEVTLTIKGKRSSTSEYNERPEVECALPKDFFGKVLGSVCDGAVVYEKQRASFDYRGCTVCLDNLGGQYFVEIEGPAEAIQKNVSSLRLESFPRIKLDYAQIVRRARKK